MQARLHMCICMLPSTNRPANKSRPTRTAVPPLHIRESRDTPSQHQVDISQPAFIPAPRPFAVLAAHESRGEGEGETGTCRLYLNRGVILSFRPTVCRRRRRHLACHAYPLGITETGSRTATGRPPVPVRPARKKRKIKDSGAARKIAGAVEVGRWIDRYTAGDGVN